MDKIKELTAQISKIQQELLKSVYDTFGYAKAHTLANYLDRLNDLISELVARAVCSGDVKGGIKMLEETLDHYKDLQKDLGPLFDSLALAGMNPTIPTC